MPEFFAPLTPDYYIEIPQDPISLVGWLIMVGLILFAAIRNRDRDFKLNQRTLIWLAILSVSILICTPFIGVQLDVGDPLPVPNRPEEPHTPYLMVFAALPWLLAGGFLGVLPAVMLAGLSGLLLAYLDTHSLFTPLIFMTVALVFSMGVRQRYRTFFYRLLRFPLFSALFGLILTIPFVFLALILSVSGEIVVRIEYAVSQIPASLTALAGMVFFASLVCVAAKALSGNAWGQAGDLIPAPGEVSLKFRLYATIGPLMLLLLIGLVIGDWMVAENAANQVMNARLKNTAEIAAEGIPYFIETGQNLILQMANDSSLSEMTPAEVNAFLDKNLRSIPFFEQLVFLDAAGTYVTSYPFIDEDALFPAPVELLAVDLALDGVRIQSYTIPPAEVGDSVRMSYFAAVMDDDDGVVGVLWGRTKLASNPFSQPFIQALSQIKDLEGEGQIVDKDGLVLFHTAQEQVMSTFTSPSYTTASYYKAPAPDGTQDVVFYQPVTGRQWAVVVSVPARQVQVIAWETAYPLLLVVLVAFVLIYFFTLFGLNLVIQTIEKVSDAAEKVARGQFDIDLPKRYHFGELGRLEYAFKHMANALKNQTRKHETLISISDQIMGVPNIDESLEVILHFAVKKGVSSARIVLTNETLLDRDQKMPLRFGQGKNTRLYAYLDNEIMALTQSRGMLVMSDVHIGKALNIAEGMPYPNSLLSIPLQRNDVFFGVLWLAYGQRKWFAEGEVNYFEDLAKRASTAINTASAYNLIVTSKKRYESVLDSLRDPVLIGDINARLIYVNAAAMDLPGVGADKSMGRLIQNVFRNDDLKMMINTAKVKPQTREIEFTNGKIYQVMVSTLRVNEQRSGVVVLLRDVSHYKELDSLKSEFVATVSHELRTPLTLILGYAQILKMIGNMNNQQETYLKKIIDGVEEMKTLVQNLLDFGRLEAGDALDISHVVAGDVIHQVVGSVEVHAEKKNIQINLAIPEEAVLLEADITFLTQALKNLVENAIKFTPMGGKVDIGVRQKDQNVVFVIRDNGIGIAPLDQRRLFEKFYQAGSHAPQNQTGSGLGLAIVKSIIERHGGRVWFESQLGKGSTFYMELPVKQPD